MSADHRPEWAWDLSDEEWAAWLRWRTEGGL